jgi:hypothetical protein
VSDKNAARAAQQAAKLTGTNRQYVSDAKDGRPAQKESPRRRTGATAGRRRFHPHFPDEPRLPA